MIKKFILSGIISVCLISVLCSAVASTANSSNVVENITYHSYSNSYEGKDSPDISVALTADNFVPSEGSIVEDGYGGYDGKVILSNEPGSVEWFVDIPMEGMYNISIEYFPVLGRGLPIERRFTINGEVPFNEAETLVFQRIFVNESSIKRDSRGNDIRPRQKETPTWRNFVLRDLNGYYNEPFKFYFKEGENNIRLDFIRESVAIKSVTIYQSKPLEAYSEVLSNYKNEGYKKTNQTPIIIEAETPAYKSDIMLYPTFDRSSPATQPYHHSQLRLNTIGGDRWKYPGQWITWETEVNESGLYKIAMRSRQNLVSGFNSSRRLYINDEVPFKEANSIMFSFSSDWEMTVPGDERGDYLFYLKEGKNTITLEVTLGDFAEIYSMAEQSVYELNKIYRRILMITGPEPDIYRDYDLEILIPEIFEELSLQLDILKDINVRILQFTNERGVITAPFERAIDRIENMLQNKERIPEMLMDFKDNVVGLGSWLLVTKEQPLELDYIMLLSPMDNVPKAEKGFISIIIHEIKSFFASFFNDYSFIGDVYNEDDSITAWVVSGRDQAQILKQMIDNNFTPDKKINVNLNLVPSNALLPATLAGKGPNVALSMGASEPINYAIRNAIIPLNKFEGYQDVEKRFHESALVPYKLDGNLYALPETQSFPMLFYRKDILEELDIEIDTINTWDDLYKIIPELQKNYLEFTLPSTNINPGGASSNLGTFGIFLFQGGGNFYNLAGSKSELNSREGIEAFKKWTRLYTNYRLPITFDFATRFRTGEIPIGIVDYTTYNLLSVFAPEINGLWGFKPVPGIQKEDGTIDRAVAGSGAACMIMKNGNKNEASWEFIKWWTDSNAQVEFARELESLMGSAARYPTANLAALEQIPWDNDDAVKISEQWKHVKGIPEIPGGYILSRQVDFAFRAVVIRGSDPREAILDYIEVVNDEISRKREEFGIE